jgi:hypothetical protein
MAHTKSFRRLSTEMRQAELDRQRRSAPHLARLKVETALAVAAFNVRVLSPSPLTFYPTIGAAIIARRFYVVCECPACGQRGSIDLRKVDRHRGASIESLIPMLSCQRCSPYSPFAKIIGLRKWPPTN